MLVLSFALPTVYHLLQCNEQFLLGKRFPAERMGRGWPCWPAAAVDTSDPRVRRVLPGWRGRVALSVDASPMILAFRTAEQRRVKDNVNPRVCRGQQPHSRQAGGRPVLIGRVGGCANTFLAGRP